MFCSNCGTKVDDNAKFCCGCGSPVGKSADRQPKASQKTTVQPAASYSNEQVKSGVNIVYPNGRSEIGDLYISQTEIVFIKKSKGVMLAFGLLGRAMEKGEEKLRLQIRDIVGGTRTRIGINPNVYQITLRNGEIYKLCLDKPKVVSYLEERFG